MILGAILIILLIGLDQGTKHLAKYLLAGGKEPTWIPYVLEFKYVENTGAAWGMLEGKSIFFFIVTLVALVIFGYLFIKSDFKKKKLYSISIVMLIAGTLGNAIDRLILNYVIDFLHVPFLSYILNIVKLSNFYFNFADLFLTIGLILLAIDLIFIEPKRSKARKGSVYGTIENQTEWY